MNLSATTIAVTGGSGYLGSWVASQLLELGHRVRTTVRTVADEVKVRHLRKLSDQHEGRLELFEADLLEEGSFDQCVDGCTAVIHVASPYFLSPPRDTQRQLIDPAVEGTENVIRAVNRAESVRRLVLTSSIVSLFSNAREVALKSSSLVREDGWNEGSDADHNATHSRKLRPRRQPGRPLVRSLDGIWSRFTPAQYLAHPCRAEWMRQA
ncbi:MAG: NAD-dependent epimerase/dehydratase family protein [Methylotenera sp.]|nr:NAD-dependent epimerase/dehydratase family protein [Methylotenera sp.]